MATLCDNILKQFVVYWVQAYVCFTRRELNMTVELESSVRCLLEQLGFPHEGAIDLKHVFIQLYRDGYISEDEYALVYHSIRTTRATESNAI